MHIVMFSINPLFPNAVMGGAPKHLQQIALHMGRLGHRVTVLCTRREDSAEVFRWHNHVEVHPVLRFHMPFPQPYAAPAYDLAGVIQHVAELLQTADRFYMHDGEFLFPFAYRHIPTVVSLRDNVYPETLLGGFLFQSDTLVLISDYSRQYYLQTVGRFFPDLDSRIRVIHNGLDWTHFRPTPPRQILSLIPFDPGTHDFVLHPHRPEATKGIFQTIEVIDRLVHHHGLTRVKALVPRWLDTNLSAELQVFYADLQTDIARRGLTDHFYFHDWIPQSLMPEYYSLGAVTLSLGSFPESFGNAVYESMGCGTPSIAARISTHRVLLPDGLIDKVDYADTETAAAIAADIIRSKRRASAETLAYLHTHYSTDRQLAAYADAILNARVVPPLDYRLTPIDDATHFRLPVWCYPSGRGVYHDFYAGYLQDDEFTRLLAAFPAGFSIPQAQAIGIPRESVLKYYTDGYLAP